MTQHSDKLRQRKEELLQEQMDKTWTSIYSQWDKQDPNYKDEASIVTTYASGRRVEDFFHRRGKPKTTWIEPMRKWLFENRWFK